MTSILFDSSLISDTSKPKSFLSQSLAKVDISPSPDS